MRIPIIVPDLGCDDEQIRVSGWLVDQGDLVLAGDFVAELMIPAVTFDILADSTGRVIAIDKPADSVVQPGEILGWLEDGIEEGDPEPPIDAP